MDLDMEEDFSEEVMDQDMDMVRGMAPDLEDEDSMGHYRQVRKEKGLDW